MAADPRFHPGIAALPLAVVLELTGGQAGGDPARLFAGIAPLDAAAPDRIAFCEGARHAPALRATRAGAVLVREAEMPLVPAGTLAIRVRSPALAFARLARRFHPTPAARPGIHPTAVVAATAQVAPDAEIGPYAVIGEGARIGAGCIIGPHAVVGDGVELGPGCRIHAHASISHALCGAGVVLHPGARVGQEGFGFVPDGQGGFVTMPQLGRVILGDAVEIGANACVDRGTQGDTVLGPGTRLDNLVQVAHNVHTGRGCVLVSQSGVSGSTTLGDHVTLAGQAGVTNHIHIGDRARVGAQSGVMRDVPAGADVLGSPALPAREAMRVMTAIRRLGADSRGRGKGGKD